MTSLSVLLIINNEEKQLQQCMKRLSFADEIIVILDKCTDRSEEIARNYTKKIFSGSWAIEGERRNFGLEKCSKAWILEIDADERISVELKNEIISKVKNSSYDWHLIELNNYVGKEIISFGWGAYFGKSAYIGLFRKNKKKWGNQRVHPKIFLNGKKGEKLENKLDHYYCKNISDFFIKLNSYSSARAIDLSDNLPKNETFFKNISRLFSRFWKSYILRKGYKEKKIGFLIALVASLYPLVSYLKLIYREKNSNS